jgi:hypothetical protein
MTEWAQLLSALDETARALAAGDVLGAAAALQVVERVREELRTEGTPLDAATLARARELVEGCSSAAAEVRRGLEEELAQAGLGRRAAAAYRVRPSQM